MTFSIFWQKIFCGECGVLLFTYFFAFRFIKTIESTAGLDPFILFLIFKFKIIHFEKTKFKFEFIDLKKKTKFKFIAFENTKFKFNFIIDFTTSWFQIYFYFSWTEVEL